MRIAFVGDFSSGWSTEVYVADALAAQSGVEVLRLQEQRSPSLDAFVRAIAATEADVFLFSKCRIGLVQHLADVLRRLRRETKSKIVCWFFDLLRKDYRTRWYDWAVRVAPECDLFLTTDSHTGEELDIDNHRLLRQGYGGPTELSFLPAKYRECPLAHLGDVYGKRVEWRDRLQLAFSKFEVFNSMRSDVQLAVLMSYVKIIVGPSWPAAPGYWSNRLYVVAGYGGCFACPGVDGMAEEGWIPGVNYIALSRDITNAIDELKYVWLMMPDEELQKIRDNARALVLERHTYRHRAVELVKMLEELK